ncbi:hypothetical protein K6V92_23110 [Cupriavidus respiraculi]|uniref:hypothetical protein n=1 Tax=Cupriavidus respiraculi TaxID=195930 RepID=UPI001C95E93B|nr:hypothetical protein [Cupriavidus respiraculi]MBY4949497.1 hypothetical protein [Cupriavidus respiraculi]
MATTLSWGLLGPGHIATQRRTRTLGVMASIRRFNDLAVPGLGGVWFGKQVVLATLGIYLAEESIAKGKRATNIETANAVEALACALAIPGLKGARDPRVRGTTMLPGRHDLSFQTVRQRGFYVTQPMRMGTVQALPALGLVSADSGRFNAFKCAQAGRELLDAAFHGISPFRRTVTEHLGRWAAGVPDTNITTGAMKDALSPMLALPSRARVLLRERLLQGGPNESSTDKARRRDALTWVEALRARPDTAISLHQRPTQITEAEHWNDIRAGAFFTLARDAAIAALDAVELHISNESSGQTLSLDHALPPSVEQRLQVVAAAAERFLQERHYDREANEFCTECNGVNLTLVLQRLVARDGRVLCLKGREIRPGPAFRGGAQPINPDEADGPAVTAGEDSPAARGGIGWPPGISFRLQNLFFLSADLHDELNRWLRADGLEPDEHTTRHELTEEIA